MTFVETRCSVWGSIAAGATGILPFKVGSPEVKYFQRHPNSGIYASPEMHLGWLKVIMPELSNLAPVLTGKTIPVAATPADRVALRVTARRYQGKNFVIAVNTKRVHMPVSIVWPDKSVKSVRVLGEKRQVKAVNGNAKSTKTILAHYEKYHVKSAIKLGDYNVGYKDNLLTLPHYMAFLLREY